METSSAATVAARIDRLAPSRYVLNFITLIALGGWFEFYGLFFTAAIGPGLVRSRLFKPPGSNPSGIGSLASFIAALFTGLFASAMVIVFIVAGVFGPTMRRRLEVIAT